TFSLQLGTEYVVYGIWIRGSEVLYSILDDDRARYPNWFPSELFEIEDGRLPTCWCYGFIAGEKPNLSGFTLSFPEWINDRTFNENLVDGDPSAQMIWQRYRLQIDNESTS